MSKCSQFFQLSLVFFSSCCLWVLWLLYIVYIFEWKTKQSYAGVCRSLNRKHKDTYWLNNGGRRAHLQYHCELGVLALFQIGCICASNSSITFSTKKLVLKGRHLAALREQNGKHILIPKLYRTEQSTTKQNPSVIFPTHKTRSFIAYLATSGFGYGLEVLDTQIISEGFLHVLWGWASNPEPCTC